MQFQSKLGVLSLPEGIPDFDMTTSVAVVDKSSGRFKKLKTINVEHTMRVQGGGVSRSGTSG